MLVALGFLGWNRLQRVEAAGDKAKATVDRPKTGAGLGAVGRYLLPFGSDPYTPSEARSSFAGFLDPAKVPTAAYCGQCHEAIYKEWRESAHANAFRTPWYQKNVNLLIEQKGIEFSRHCEGCHNPTALPVASEAP